MRLSDKIKGILTLNEESISEILEEDWYEEQGTLIALIVFITNGIFIYFFGFKFSIIDSLFTSILKSVIIGFADIIVFSLLIALVSRIIKHHKTDTHRIYALIAFSTIWIAIGFSIIFSIKFSGIPVDSFLTFLVRLVTSIGMFAAVVCSIKINTLFNYTESTVYAIIVYIMTVLLLIVPIFLLDLVLYPWIIE
ncbi:MAG: hypothetical protein ACTSPG_08830 [Candidatus Hodarchaeales archaeon]